MSKKIMIDINIQELEDFLKQNKMTFTQLSLKMFSSISYFTHVKKQKKMMQVKYKTMVEVLGVPYGTFTIGDIFKVQSSQEKKEPVVVWQMHTKPEQPEQIELISIEHEMLLEMKKLTSTMQEILNVLKGCE